MAATVQLQTSAAAKSCTSNLGASAARGNAATTRPFVQLPLPDFTKTFLAGALEYNLKTSEQSLLGKHCRLTVSASAGRDATGVPIPCATNVSTRPRNRRPTTHRAVALSDRVAFQSQDAEFAMEAETKRCITCHREKPLIDYQKSGKRLRQACRACVAVGLAERSGKDMYHLSMSVDEAWAKAKPCAKCKVVKELRDYASSKKTRDGIQTRCRACNAVQAVERLPDEPESEADGAWTDLAQSTSRHQNGAGPQVLQLPEAIKSYTQGSEPVSAEVPYYHSSVSAGWDPFAFEAKDEPLNSNGTHPSASSAWDSAFFGKQDDIIIPEVEPSYQGHAQEASHEASDMVAALQVKLLRLDFDLTNARAGKAIFEDQVQYLERVMAARTDDNDQLRSALADASSSLAELSVHVDRLESEGSELREKLLRLDFDLVHARATRGILEEKVDDLERAVALETEAAQVRDEKLKTVVESNAILTAELEAAQSEGSNLRSEVLNLSLDLAHVSAGKKILSSKVEDLEKMLAADAEASRIREEQVALAIAEAEAAINDMERLREESNSLRSKLMCSDFDLTHANATKNILSEKVDDFEKAMAAMHEEEEDLKAAFARVTAANAELENQVAALQTEQAELRSNALRFSLDLANSRAMKKIFEGRTEELERRVAAYEEAAQEREVTLMTALADSYSAIAEMEAQREEMSDLRMQVLRLDMDLTHTRATKQLLGIQVEDLERELGATRMEDEALKAALQEAVEANDALEAEVAKVQEEGSELRSQVLRLSLDLAHVSAGRKIYGERVEDLERMIQLDAEASQKRDEMLRAAQSSNMALKSDVERLTAEGDAFRTQLLRRDLDLAHTVALKQLLDGRCEELERTIAAHDDAGAKLSAALSANAELEAQMQRLEAESGALRTQVLMKDFDLTHADALKGLLGARISDLERAIQAHEDMGAKLRAAFAVNSQLQAEIGNLKDESDSLRTQLLRKDFDLTHTRAMKAVFDERVASLERVIEEHEDLGTKLTEANYSMAELEAQVAHLEAERNAFQTELMSRDFDLTHIRAMKSALEEKVQDLERTIENHDDLGTQLRASQAMVGELTAEVARLGAEGRSLRSQVLSKDFDLTHTRALKAMLDDKVGDLERVIAAHDELGEKLAAAEQANAKLEAQVEEIVAEKGALETQLLIKDFDLTHAQAVSAILDNKIQDLERVIAAHDDLGAKLKAAYSSEAELAARVSRLEVEGGDMKTKLLLQDFDLTNTRTMKSILHDKVQDLERVIAAHDDLGAKLRAARFANTSLEAKVESLEAKEGMLQAQLLRKDFDLAHTHALKALLDDKVQLLERRNEDLDELAQERLAKLKDVLAEAEASNTELERLRAEGAALQLKAMTADLDIAHERHGKSILAEKVDDLERTIESYDEIAKIRDKRLSEALSLIEELETEGQHLEAEREDLRTTLLRQEFDLVHASATKALLGERVETLEAQGEQLSAALEEALSAKAKLEEKVAELQAAMRAAMKEERTLRANYAELKRQVYNLKFDNSALNRTRVKRAEILEEKERQLAETEKLLEAATNEAVSLSRQLVVAKTGLAGADAEVQSEKQLAGITTLTTSVQEQEEKSLAEALSLISRLEEEVARLEAEGGEFRSDVLTKDLDLANIRATKAVLDGRLQDLQNQGEKLSTAVEEVNTQKDVLEDKVGYLEGVLKAVEGEERSLRGGQTELKKQLFNLKVDNMALHRAKTQRSELLAEKERELADLTEALARTQNEAAYLVRQLADARSTQARNDRRGYGSDSDDEASAGAQLAKIASLTVALQQKQKEEQERQEQERKAEAEAAAKAEAEAAAKAEAEAGAKAEAEAGAKAEAAAEVTRVDPDSEDYDDDDDPDLTRKANRTMNAAGASVLISSLIGLSLSLGPPTNAPPLRTLVSQTMTMTMNPVEQLAEVVDMSEEAEYVDAKEAEVGEMAEAEYADAEVAEAEVGEMTEAEYVDAEVAEVPGPEIDLLAEVDRAEIEERTEYEVEVDRAEFDMAPPDEDDERGRVRSNYPEAPDRPSLMD